MPEVQLPASSYQFVPTLILSLPGCDYLRRATGGITAEGQKCTISRTRKMGGGRKKVGWEGGIGVGRRDTGESRGGGGVGDFKIYASNPTGVLLISALYGSRRSALYGFRRSALYGFRRCVDFGAL